MALALYRKYRPATFAEVVGQEHVTDPLRTALQTGRINHAYLFSGPRGCGKTSSARILARSLNCVQGPTPEPCGVCSSCVSLAPGGPGNIDVTELDAASHGGVDDTRELRDRAFFAPAESRYRVFIVDEAHMITTQGFNALLKIVEEPPEHLVFVFATTEPEKVLPTIRSRTHHYPFRLIPPGTLRKLLESICVQEGVTVAPAVYPLVIRAGGGSARDSLSVLDQLVSGAGPEGVTYERAVALLGVTDVALIDDVVDALAAGDRAAVFEAVDRLVEAGHDPRRFAADLLQRLRDLTLLQAIPEAVERGLVEGAADELNRMVDQSTHFGTATLTRYGEILHAGLTEMRGATAPRLLLELLCARMLLPAATVEDAGLLERLERLERRSAIAASPLPAGETGDSRDSERRFERPSVAAGRPTAGPVAGSGGEQASGRTAGPTAAPDRATDPTVDRDGSAQVSGSARSSSVEAGAGHRERGEADGQADPRRDDPPAAPVDPPSADAAPVRAAAEVGATDVRRVWQEIQDVVKQRKKRTAALLVSATVRTVENDTLVLSIGTAPLARLLSEQSNTDVVAEALHSVLGVRWRVRCEHDDGSSPVHAAESRGAGAAPAGRGSPPDRRGAGVESAVTDPRPDRGDGAVGSGGVSTSGAATAKRPSTADGPSRGVLLDEPSAAETRPGGTAGSATPGAGIAPAVSAVSGAGTSGAGTSGLGTSGLATSGVITSSAATSSVATAGVGTSGLATSGLATSGLATSGLATSGLATSGVGMSGLATSGVGTSGVGTASSDTSGVGTSGVSTSGVGTSGSDTSGVGAPGVGASGSTSRDSASAGSAVADMAGVELLGLPSPNGGSTVSGAAAAPGVDAPASTSSGDVSAGGVLSGGRSSASPPTSDSPAGVHGADRRGAGAREGREAAGRDAAVPAPSDRLVTATRTGGIVDHLPSVGDVLPASGAGVPSGGAPSGTRSDGRAPGGARPTSERSAEARRPRFERRSARLAGTSTPDEGVPLPPEPPDEDIPPDDEEALLAELDSGESAPAPATSDPERAAMALLTTHLGARAIDNR